MGIRIGELASRAGVSVDTVRYYERQRLLPRAARTEGNFRLFPEDAVERIRFIKGAQSLGFSLAEINDLLSPKGKGAEECRQMHSLLRAHLDELDERLKALQDFRNVLVSHISSCEDALREIEETEACPVKISITRPSRASKQRCAETR